MINNPILPGFHPDPSICRVGNNYYIATSTFEWWPAVRIHHSKDLVNWKHCTYAVTRTSQLDLKGHMDSTGVWAPCLSYADGQFWLIYSDVRSMYGAYKDVHNYLITAPAITGPWSEPVYMNSSGFDPSLFHDDDGRAWFMNQQWLHHPSANPFNGILLQEYDKAQKKLVGTISNIFFGSSLGVVEGPHFYKKNGYYYLLTAEGGTFYEHAVTLARSKSIVGPYEIMPNNPLLTSYKKDNKILQRSGHASLVETPEGEWYLAHLCGRPVQWNRPSAVENTNVDSYDGLNCILGRETALQKMRWREDGWLEVVDGSHTPLWAVEVPGIKENTSEQSECDHFDSPILNPEFNSLRVPCDESWVSLIERPGYLRLKGRESLMSAFEQSLIARRQQHMVCNVETQLEFEPDNFQQMAGLVVYYGTNNHIYCHLTIDATSLKRVLRLYVNKDGILSEPYSAVEVGVGPVKLKADFLFDKVQFSFCLEKLDWEILGTETDILFLSDEFVTRSREGFFYSFGFTGNYVGMACQDLSGLRKKADFDYFKYTY
jgi:xylan 1,4-beta-xylosidase